jgi:YHS domain-containing protein
VANDGNCVVCLKMAKKEIPGKAGFTSVYKGKRYLFPSTKERATFDADPASFVVEKKREKESSDKEESISVTGKTACSGCGYGVRPITDSDSLGMAVVAGDKVYVVEGGERRYPDLYKARFDGLKVQLRGTVKKTQGKFVWVEPTSLAPSR